MSNMHIGIDISAVVYQRGVSSYTANLVRSLAARRDVELRVYGCSFRQKSLLESFIKKTIPTHSPHQSHIQSYPPKLQNILWNTLHQNPVKNLFPDLDLFHSWDWIQPPDKNVPLVSTIHDLAILKFPETAHPEILKMHQQSWNILRQRNAHIIAVSYATKHDILELLNFPADHVHVVYEALPRETVEIMKTMDEDTFEKIKSQLPTQRPFMLFVGTREPRKNLNRLIEAWTPLADQIDLVIAGEKGWDQLKLGAKQDRVHLLGQVSAQQLAVLYETAELLAYPSMYEGFGLPILEAFHHGLPVVTSNASSLPEVAGNAAELIDPNSVESIRIGIEKILHETTEQQQQRLQKMIIRLQRFDWARVAEETIAVYRQAVAG